MLQLWWVDLRMLLVAAITGLLGPLVAPEPARAGMVPTEAVIEAAAGEAGARARVEAFLGRAEMRRQLEALGVDPDEAASRAESLTDKEIALIAGKLEHLPVGAATVPVEIILAVLAVLLLIVILI